MSPQEKQAVMARDALGQPRRDNYMLEICVKTPERMIYDQK